MESREEPTMYSYVKRSETVSPVDHADHIWEEWHAYVCDISDAPSFVDGNSTGVCCHTCQTIVID
jgi:hypothetical protein